jgi:hypothetical protein
VLAGLRREGVADSALLSELGLQLTEEGKIRSKPPSSLTYREPTAWIIATDVRPVAVMENG